MPVKTHVNHTDAGNVIQRSNGATTFTEVMTKHLHKTYDTRRQDGLNEELMLDVLDQIEHHQVLWDQGSWRALMEASLWPDEERQAIKDSMAAFALDTAGQSLCGTAMCFAGWVSELADVDWVVDARVVTQFRQVCGKDAHLDELSPWAELLFVPREEFNAAYSSRYDRVDDLDWYTITAEGEPTYLPALVAQVAKSRGFGPTTHAVIDVPGFATAKLGIGPDVLELFEGSNTLATVRRRVQGYLRFGPIIPACLAQMIRDNGEEQVDVDQIDPSYHGSTEDWICEGINAA